MNRLPLESSRVFADRGDRVKWPTIRKAWLTDDAVKGIENYVTGIGKSIIFLDGRYNTNLNFDIRGPNERAVFFEFLMKHPRVKGGIFMLSWIGDYHNGCIYHCAWQYPQVKCWESFGTGAEEMFERAAHKVYKRITQILYEHSEYEMDQEVKEFIT
jgi:hypothetical protein